MAGLPSTHAFASPDSGVKRFAGEPNATVSGGTVPPGVTVEPAATIARGPTTAPSSTVALLPISASAPIVQWWIMHRWPTVAPGPTSQTPSPTWITELSCTFAPARITTAPKSARMTTPYQIEASASTVTSPTSVAVGATHADGCTAGLLPSNANIGMATPYVRPPRHRLDQRRSTIPPGPNVTPRAACRADLAALGEVRLEHLTDSLSTVPFMTVRLSALLGPGHELADQRGDLVGRELHGVLVDADLELAPAGQRIGLHAGEQLHPTRGDQLLAGPVGVGRRDRQMNVEQRRLRRVRPHLGRAVLGERAGDRD